MQLLSLYISLRRRNKVLRTGSFSWRHLNRPPNCLFFLIEVHLIPFCLLILFNKSDHLNFISLSCGSSFVISSFKRHSSPILRFVKTFINLYTGCSTFLFFQYSSIL
ncbi:hypothetical protein C2G38_2110073 [Gigaspora rosea]|uniref:Uncharacterized protein n=1 Tax=Gigaspora rosea TaxID=44941 RepID=A0A397UI08_9GLOM|nr:hypothetical protein C2G38_2110073 [Gigaspora rosea]